MGKSEINADFVDGAKTFHKKVLGSKKITTKITHAVVPFDIGEHKDDKRYVEYPDNGKTTRKYKDNCKLTYTRDSAGKVINFKWVTYKH